MFRFIFALFFLLSTATLCWSHDLQYEVANANVIVLNFFYKDNSKFSYEGYEVYAPEEKIPFQVGRTDKLGRMTLLPDRQGIWRIKIFSKDGHGLDFTIEVGKDRVLKQTQKPLFARYLNIFVGLGIILGLFGILKLFFRKKDS